MAEKCRSLNFFLLVCALIGGLLFYGCGGGTSSDPLPIRELKITGNVSSAKPLASMAAPGSEGLLPDVRASFTAANIEVYLESNRAQFSTRTDSEGNFVLSGIPAGSHRIVALFIAPSGNVFKVRSGEISVSDQERTSQAPAMSVAEATSRVSGRIIDANGNPVVNGRLALWGETFFTDSDGKFTSPPMPESATKEQIIIDIPGFQATTIEVAFTENTPYIEQTVVSPSATNRPPVSTLVANRYELTTSSQSSLTATASDPDNDTLTYAWSATAGTLATGSSQLNAVWTAPSESTVATITFSATDPGGLRSANSVAIKVGTGQISQNNPPSVTDIVCSSTVLLANTEYVLTAVATDSDKDALYYTWTASQGTMLDPVTNSSVTWRTPVIASTTNIQVAVKVDDKKGGVVYKVRSFQVTNDPSLPPNQPPVVTISSPANLGLFLPGTISFSGSATDPEEGAVAVTSLTWFETAPGGTSQQVADKVNAHSRNLTTPGTYSATLYAKDSLETVGSLTIQFRINSAPTVAITSPTNNSNHGIGANITFTASATDVEDGALAGTNVIWTFPAATGIGVLTGNTHTTNAIPEGQWDVMVNAKDSLNTYSATATVRINVNNQGPNMVINQIGTNSPAGEYIMAGADVLISGSGTDYQSNPVAASTMKWELSAPAVANPPMASIATMTLLTGVDNFVASFSYIRQHIVTLTGFDAAVPPKSRSVSRSFYVNATPTVNITQPASGTRFDLNASVMFTASASDPDANDTLSVRWWRDNGAALLQIGTGTSYLSMAGDLPHGNRQIVCEVVDKYGIASHSLINIMVNTIPIAEIDYSGVFAYGLASRPIFMSNNPSTPITFNASSTDPEAAILASDHRWFTTYNDVKSQVGTGTSITTPLELGISTLTLTVYDSYGASFSSDLCVQVWQDRTFDLTGALGTTVNTATDITGTSLGLSPNLIFSITDLDRTVEAQFVGNFGADYLDVQNDFDNASAGATMSPALTSTYASFAFQGKMHVLGIEQGTGDTIFKEYQSVTENHRTYSTGLTAPSIAEARSVSTDNIRLFVCYPDLNTISLINPSPAIPEITNSLTSANGVTFSDPNRIRYSNVTYGKVFVADKGENRIVRFGDVVLGTPLEPLPVTAPEDVAMSTSFLFTINATTGQVTIFDPFTSQVVMTFGTSGTGLGQFNSPKAIYCSGYDLFVLENTRLRVIRSGTMDWFK